MDLSLQLFIASSAGLSFLSFNPCFNGSFTSTHIEENQHAEETYVSILVLMDLSLQHVYYKQI